MTGVRKQAFLFFRFEGLAMLCSQKTDFLETLGGLIFQSILVLSDAFRDCGLIMAMGYPGYINFPVGYTFLHTFAF